MVSKLRYFRSKRSFVKWVRSLGYGKEVIDSCWEGPGWYYHRGRRDLRLPDTISPWELKALFE